MIKYYTRACNFKYSSTAKQLIKAKKPFLCAEVKIAFDEIEIITRVNKKLCSRIIHYKKINTLNSILKNKVRKDLKNIISKRKNFLKHVNFFEPSIMGILNLTPDSFSDGANLIKITNL